MILDSVNISNYGYNMSDSLLIFYFSNSILFYYTVGFNSMGISPTSLVSFSLV